MVYGILFFMIKFYDKNTTDYDQEILQSHMNPQGIIRMYHECEGWIEKSVPRITDWHHEFCRVMANGDREGRIFLSHPHTNNGFFFLLTTKYRHFVLENMKKGFQKILNTLRCDMVTSFYHCNDVTKRRAASVR